MGYGSMMMAMQEAELCIWDKDEEDVDFSITTLVDKIKSLRFESLHQECNRTSRVHARAEGILDLLPSAVLESHLFQFKAARAGKVSN